MKFVSFHSDRFVIIPPKEAAEEEVRPRPASLRQQPKRRFSTFVSSPQELQPSTSNAQPPISLRFKRISDPSPVEQPKMPPPIPNVLEAATKPEIINLSSLNLIYLCNYCDFHADTFDKVHAHWLRVHKKGEDPVAKRFSYRVTRQLKCVYCTQKNTMVTYQTIRTHMLTKHPGCAYVFAIHDANAELDTIQCGICWANVKSVDQLISHFVAAHPISQKPDRKIEPLPIMTDGILSVLQTQGDQGTFKCKYCSCYYSCRYDYEQHHKESHTNLLENYELNGKDIVKYGCFICRQTKTDETMAIDHIHSHIGMLYQCMHCKKKVKLLSMLDVHNKISHKDKPVAFAIVNAREQINLYYQMTLTFSNGLTLNWGDVLKTKYGDAVRIVKYINDLNSATHKNQLKQATALAAGRANGIAGKIGQRRQTLL